VVADHAVGETPVGVLTGDLLFAGDVGRPEFFGALGTDAATMHAEARLVRDSLSRLAALPDFLQIWPGHGAGELHARAVTATPQSTLGYERQVNWALRAQADEAFTAALLRDPPDLPQCRRVLKAMNCAGTVVTSGTGEVPMRSRLEAQEWIAGAGFVVDSRPADVFAQAFLPGSLNIPGTHGFTRWFGSLITYELPVWLLVTDEAQGAALLHDLQLIGFDGVVGVTVASDALTGTFSTALASQSAVALAGSLGRDGMTVLDVRSRGEFTAGHVAGALHVPLGELPQRLAEVPSSGTLVTTCADGERAAIAASLLLMAGAPAVENLHGGLAAWTTAGYTLTTITD
jgi:hydroxyacylglutathione hydrolase